MQGCRRAKSQQHKGVIADNVCSRPEHRQVHGTLYPQMPTAGACPPLLTCSVGYRSGPMSPSDG